MAAAFDRAGFEAVDVHMSDLLEGRTSLDGFRGLAACGGFSYGDVLGAGEGWAKSILFNAARPRGSSQRFFARADTFALGVCNGCQMLSNLHELIPGAERWPRFVRNRSEQFEARLSLVEIAGQPLGAARAAWPARGCPSRWPTARGGPSSRSAGDRDGAGARAAWWRRASSTTAAAPPSATPRTPTARPAASPR